MKQSYYSSICGKTFLHKNANNREQIDLIQNNLEMRAVTLEKSFAKYKQGGQAFEKIVQEYLRIHLAILQCNEEIEELASASVRLGNRK